MLAECDLGHRVVVRRAVGVGQHGRPIFTDVLGELVGIDGERLTVRTDKGELTEIALVEVHAAKRIPARPARYSEIAALELVADRAWPAPTVERLGTWLLRAADGWTNRANSALPIGDAGRSLADAIAYCEAWYTDRELVPMITVPLPLRRDVADALTARGWSEHPVVLVQVAGVTDVIARTTADRVELSPAPTPEWLASVGARKGGVTAAALTVITSPARVRFAQVRDPVRDPAGRIVAAARGVVVDDWLHLGLLGVQEEARRQGLAQQLTGSLARWAADEGATRILLQVEERNAPAVALYERLAFHTHHRYITYRR